MICMITVGIDEVGRGCWAGPLVAGAVVLPPRFRTKRGRLQLRDSKLLTRAQREAWDDYIRRRALAIGLGWIWPQEIDRIGLTAAVRLAMKQALSQIVCAYDEIIIDGSINYLANTNVKGPSSHTSRGEYGQNGDVKGRTFHIRAVVKADNSVPAVSAAAIVAKVARDRYMSEAAETYPGYGFEQHVGYGTAAHIAGLKLLGACDIHRRSYKPIQALCDRSDLAQQAERQLG